MPWKSSIKYFCVCMCVCVHARAHTYKHMVEGMRASICVCGCESTDAGVCLRACSLTYPLRHAQAPYSLQPLWLHHIFLHYLINDGFSKKTFLNIKCVFGFPLQILCKTFLILGRIQRDIVINVKKSSCKVPVILVGF